MRTLSTIGLIIMGLVASGAASSGQSRPMVLELFTSEGCSSCPPAEALLGELAGRPDVLALAFHVDYWDGMGWRDKFAFPMATERQRLYAKNLGSFSVYTPQLVVDGRRDFVGSDRVSVGHALAQARAPGVMLNLAVHEGTVSVTLERQAGVRLSDVLLVAYQKRVVSRIGRGENAGRELEEFNIVRALRPLGHWAGAPQQFEAPVGTIPTDATDVAILVQMTGGGPIIGAVSTPLR
jgi:hypothetical protein